MQAPTIIALSTKQTTVIAVLVLSDFKFCMKGLVTQSGQINDGGFRFTCITIVEFSVFTCDSFVELTELVSFSVVFCGIDVVFCGIDVVFFGIVVFVASIVVFVCILVVFVGAIVVFAGTIVVFVGDIVVFVGLTIVVLLVALEFYGKVTFWDEVEF